MCKRLTFSLFYICTHRVLAPSARRCTIVMSAPNENSPFRSDQETSIKYYSIQELSNKRARMKKNKGFLDRDASNASSFKVTLLQVFYFFGFYYLPKFK